MQKREFLAAAVSSTSWAAISLTPWLTACSAPRLATKASAAEQIYLGGPILTMSNPRQVQAVAVGAGRILAAGSEAEIMAWRGPSTRVVDLQGATMLPGFVDPHSHLGGVGLQAISANLLPPPDGNNASIADLQQTYRTYLAQSPEPATLGIAFGFGYDDSQLLEQRHPTRDDLDAISATLPIVAIHQSGHFAALNSAALNRAGISAASPNPEGGVIRRRAGGTEPDGVLEENAYFNALPRIMPQLSQAQAISWLEKAQQLYLSYGYTTVQDGRADPGAVATAIAAAQAGKLLVDVVSYPDILQLGEGSFMRGPYFGRGYNQHLRIGGVKLTLDGSPQGKTAWLTEPYLVPPEGQGKNYRGYGVISDEQARNQVAKAVNNGWQILVHANGDAAIDQFIAAVKAAGPQVKRRDLRPVLIHGQTLRYDQVAQLKELGIFPSLFPMHTFYWGDWHRDSVLGHPRAQNISPTGWVLDAGLPFTSHHDAPVALPSSTRVLDATVNRRTRSGQVLGPEHRVSPWTALLAQTRWAAYQHFEEDSKGSIEVGKSADFAILSDNPLTMPLLELASLTVLETIKEGRRVYRAPKT